MRKSILTFIACLTATITFAQKVTLAGTVTDKQNKPVAFAFIKDATHNYATFSDAGGGFTLEVDNADRVIVSARNFTPVVVKVSDPQKVNVVMADYDASKPVTKINSEVFKDRLSSEGLTRNAGSVYVAHENTVHGSRYLFEDWVHGYVTTMADSIKQNDSYLFNYIKTEGNLLFTDDGSAVKEIDRRLIKGFTLVDNQGQSFVFESVPAIDPNHFVQLLETGKSYKIYKQLITKFIPNNYVSNGMTSSGNNYDELKDEPVYYAVRSGGAPVKFALKSKSIKTTFAADVDKVKKFESAHDSDEIDDKYLIGLGEFLNN
ncbi:MAG: carboxypeptidase-like regulatory domain-containing protein [Bacteroidota bacterium]|nr:carboxypeptidase-like regulatory domain-containing protein [Bacteroidota bacterium]